MRKNTHPKDFESAVTELESTVTLMESGQMPLDQALAAYQRGTELVQFCRQALSEVEQKIRLLDDAQQLQPYADQND
jgi:exodeoxyribonuclease VII small subunit